MILIKEKLHAGGSLKLTGFLWPENNEPAADSFFITSRWLAHTPAACLSQAGKRATERLSTKGGLEGAGSAFKLRWWRKRSLVCTFSPQWDNKE